MHGYMYLCLGVAIIFSEKFEVKCLLEVIITVFVIIFIVLEMHCFLTAILQNLVFGIFLREIT